MYWQQQECQNYSSLLGILHTYTLANYLYGSMCRHIHTSLILLCPLCSQLSSLWLQTHVYLHWDDIISVLKWVQYIEYFMIFSTCMYLVPFAYILSLSFLGMCSLVLLMSVILYVLHVCFDTFSQNLASIIHIQCININYFSLWYTLWMHVIVQISLSFMRFLKCYSLPFPAFMTLFTDRHSHGSAKHWSYSSVSIHRYLLISTKR